MMKLLLDQNLSWRLAEHLQDLFPGSIHVREAGLDRASDEVVWEYARRERYIIISKDSDFQQRSLLFGSPPKCVWIRVGNCATSEIEQLIRKQVIAIQEFTKLEDESYLILP